MGKRSSPGICACASKGLLMDFLFFLGVLTIKLVSHYSPSFPDHHLRRDWIVRRMSPISAAERRTGQRAGWSKGYGRPMPDLGNSLYWESERRNERMLYTRRFQFNSRRMMTFFNWCGFLHSAESGVGESQSFELIHNTYREKKFLYV